jgi:hypothetical protein
MSTKIVQSPANKTNITNTQNITTIKSTTSNKTVVVHSALVGEKGQDSSTLNIVAEETINAFVLVSVGSNGGVIVSDPNVTTFVVGVSLKQVIAGEFADIVTIGKVTNPDWNFTPDKPVYLSTNGEITHDPYTGTLVVCVGRSLNNNTIILQIQQPIVRVL